MIGERFGRYRVDAVLGEGGMGTVYAAFDEQLGRDVALKVVRADKEERDRNKTVADEGMRARLVREARAASLLKHHSVVTIYDVGEIDGAAFIAMERIDGQSLRTMVGDDEIPLEPRLVWLSDLAAALGAAHTAGLVHRDVKPENVMVMTDGRIKVLDFGIARAAQSGTNTTGLATLTQDGTTMGTPAYMAPEQIRAEKIDGRADQFSWGVVAFELLSGRLPFEAKEPLALAVEIATKDAPLLSKVGAEVPPEVEATVARALAKNAEDRFPTMEVLMEAMQGSVPADTRRAVALASAPRPALGPDQKTFASAPRRAEPLATTHLAQVTVPSALRPKRRAWIPIAAAVGALGIGGGIFALARKKDVPAGAPSTSPSAEKARLQELFEAGRAELRRGVRTTNWETAQGIDDGYPPVALRMALLRFGYAPTVARGWFRKARDRKAELSASDAALLDAMAPTFETQPPDLVETRMRMEALAVKFPKDAEIAYFHGIAISNQAPGEVTAYLAAYTKAITVDPGFTRAWQLKAEAEAYLGKRAEAAKSVERCLEVEASSEQCLLMRALLDQDAGACERMLGDARRRQANDPASARPYEAIGGALAALGRADDAVLAALEQRWDRVPAEEKATAQGLDRGSLAVLRGDWQGAEKHFLEWQKAVASAPDATTHAAPARALVDLYVEIGRNADAAKVASAHLARAEALVQNPRIEDFAVATDPTPMMLDALGRARRLTVEEVETKKRAWAKAAVAKGGEWLLPWIWSYGWARTVDDAGSAKRAVEALDALKVPTMEQDGAPLARGLPTFAPLTPTAGWVGTVLVHSGDHAGAIPLLLAATKDCRVLYSGMDAVRARVALALAYERAGTRDRACDEYRTVAQTWRTEGSKTADAAREGIKRLSCQNP